MPDSLTDNSKPLPASRIMPRPADLHRYPAHNLVAWQPQGVLDDQLLDEIGEWLCHIEKVSVPFNRFVDFSRLTSVAVRTKHVFAFARKRAEQYAGGPPVKSALFSEYWVSFGIALMYENLMKKTPIDVHAFLDRTNAADWLGVPEEILKLEDKPGPPHQAYLALPRAREDVSGKTPRHQPGLIRFADLLLVASRFETRHFRYIGGTLLLLVFNEIAGNFTEDDVEIIPLIRGLIALENFVIDNKVLPSNHVYMVCQKTDDLLLMQTRNVLPRAASVFPSDDLESLTVRTRAVGLLAAEPNPFRADSRGVGSPTMSWMTYAKSRVEIHVNAADGPIFARSGPGRFSQKIGPRGVCDGTRLYLQDVSDGLPLTSENTIAVITLRSV